MATYRIAVLPGDGIGQEVTPEAVRVLKAVGKGAGVGFEFEQALVGGAEIDATGSPLAPGTLELCRRSHAILFGAVGGPKWDGVAHERRPERGLLALRKELDLYANLRPAKCFPMLVDASPLKRSVVEGTDLMMIRELTGGLYFGERRGIERVADGGARAVNTMVYTSREIDRIARTAFEVARGRRKRLASVDKANVLVVSQLWREVVTRVGQNYPDVVLEHVLEYDVGVVLADARHDLAPELGDDQNVGLVHRGEALPAPPGHLEGGPGDPVDLARGVDHGVDRARPTVGDTLYPAGLPEIQAPRELADHHEVRALDDRSLQGRGVHEHREALRRPQVRVEVQLLAQGEEPALRPSLVRDAVPVGATDGAKEDRVGPSAQLKRAGRQRAPGRVDRGAPDERLLELEADAGPLADRLENPHGLGSDLLPDAVAGEDRDPVRGHLWSDFLDVLGGGVGHPVERREIRPRARLDHVRRRALAPDDRPVEVDLHRHLTDRVLARRRGTERVVLEPTLHPRDRVDRVQHRVDGPVAHARVLEHLPLLLELHGRRRHHARPADHVQVLELVPDRALRRLVGDDRHQVFVEDLLLPVGEVLEGLECPVEVGPGEVEAQIFEPRRQGVPPRVLAQDELVGRPSDVLRPHDLVRELLLQHTVLVDPRLVGERVLAHDCLVRLDVDARDVREEPRGLEDLLGLHARVDAEEVLASAKRHHDLLERRVPRPLADPVDGALDLPRPVHDGRQRVGDRLAEVVVAVDREDHLLHSADLLADPGDALAPLARDRVADGVGNVDRLRPRLDHRRQHVAHVVEVRARGVLGRELDVLAVALRVPHGVDRRLQHFGPGLPQLVLQVDVGGRDEGVDPGLPRILHRLPTAVDVRQPHAREAADRRRVLERADLLGDLARRLEVLVR